MIFCVFTTFSENHCNILDILHKNFPFVLILLNNPEIIQFYKNKNILNKVVYKVYNNEEELNKLYSNYLASGYSLIVKDNETIKFYNKQAYSIYLKIQPSEQLFIETPHFKKRGKISEELLTDVIIESFKNGHVNIAFRYKSKDFIIKGSPNQTYSEMPLLNIDDNNISKQYVSTNTTESKIKIVPLTNWTSPHEFVQHLNRFRPNDTKIEFGVSNQAEYALVVNETDVDTNSGRTIYFMMEPNGEKLYENYLNKYNTPQSRLLFKGDHSNHLNLQEYWLNKTVQQLQSETIQKTIDYNNILSVCVSNRYVDPGHKYRIDLIKELDKGCSEGKYPIQIHIYGKCKSLGFKNYKGECPERDKSNALLKYKYHFNAENHQIDNYITEKFNDALMSETYLFYHGAKNASNYFENSFTSLSGDVDTDITTIVREITENKWDKNIEQIRKVKRKAIMTQNIFYRLESIIEFSKSVFIRLFNTDVPQPVDVGHYQKNGWNMVAACLSKVDSQYNYLEMILNGSGALQSKLNIVLSWKDNFEQYDTFSFNYLSKLKENKDKEPDLILLDTNYTNEINIFEQTIFIPFKTLSILANRLKEGKRTKETLLENLKIE